MNVAAKSISPATAEGIRKFDHIVPIVASDAEIAAAIKDADLPALIAALATLTSDARLLSDDLLKAA
jgi:4-hydroxyacetophenone monooxygenase